MQTARRAQPFRRYIIRSRIAAISLATISICLSWLARRNPETNGDDKVIADRVAKHTATHVEVISYGGEPLLIGPDSIVNAASILRAATSAQVGLRVRTNGTPLSDNILDTLASHDIKIAVSLDRAPRDNDQHRHYVSGRGSHTDVDRSLARLQVSAPMLSAGIICTIDLKSGAAQTFDAICEFIPPLIDIQPPQSKLITPPPSRGIDNTDTPYGQWVLATVSDRWYSDSPVGSIVRMFSKIFSRQLSADRQSTKCRECALHRIRSDGSYVYCYRLVTGFSTCRFAITILAT